MRKLKRRQVNYLAIKVFIAFKELGGESSRIWREKLKQEISKTSRKTIEVCESKTQMIVNKLEIRKQQRKSKVRKSSEQTRLLNV